MTKAILVVLDGLGDRPIKELGERTPLEAAKKPNLDRFAKNGICGIMDTVDVGIRPGSDTAHLSLFGYNPRIFYSGRGPFEAAGVGIEMRKGDVAFRCNIGTVNNKMIITDRRAGRIESSQFIKKLEGIKIGSIEFIIKPGPVHRAALVMRGKNLSSKISDVDPHKEGVMVMKARPLDSSREAEFTAVMLNKYLEKVHKILKEHPENKKREKEGKPPGNYLLVRGAGIVSHLPSFKEYYGLRAACVAFGLYRGISKMLEMDIIETEDELEKRILTAKKALNDHDFVFLHIKNADSLSEDGNYKGKKEFIERVDRAMKELTELKDTLIVVTADHSTPCALRAHSGDPVPIIMYGPGVRKDDVKTFGERSCAKGGMNRIRGLDLVNEIVNIMGRQSLYGD